MRELSELIEDALDEANFLVAVYEKKAEKLIPVKDNLKELKEIVNKLYDEEKTENKVELAELRAGEIAQKISIAKKDLQTFTGKLKLFKNYT